MIANPAPEQFECIVLLGAKNSSRTVVYPTGRKHLGAVAVSSIWRVINLFRTRLEDFYPQPAVIQLWCGCPSPIIARLLDPTASRLWLCFAKRKMLRNNLRTES